jgi:hypothetical protein
MGKDIIIEQAGDPQELTGAAKLSIPMMDGGASLWVPEDTRGRVVRAITANGTYAAASDGGYAYGRLTVAVGLNLPYAGETSGGASYTLYQGGDGRPYIRIAAAG